MSAVDALKAARAAGVEFVLDGDALALEAAAAPPPAVLDQLARYKTGLMALLRPTGDGWSALDAGCVVEWLNRNPDPSAPGRCAWCGGTECLGAVVLPFGTEPETHTWLHSYCWSAWHAARNAEAFRALAAMGIDQPRTNR
jgi:hypothetical protein